MWVSTVSILIFIIHTFAQVYINLVDQYQEGYNSSYGTYGAASSLRQNGEVDFNFKDYDNFFNNFYRVRVHKASNLDLKHISMFWVNIWYSDSDFRYKFTFWTPMILQIYIRLQKVNMWHLQSRLPWWVSMMNMIVGHLWWWIKPFFLGILWQGWCRQCLQFPRTLPLLHCCLLLAIW